MAPGNALHFDGQTVVRQDEMPRKRNATTARARVRTSLGPSLQQVVPIAATLGVCGPNRGRKGTKSRSATP